MKLRNPRNKKLYQLEFQVVDKDCTVPLLGKRASEAMKLIKVQLRKHSGNRQHSHLREAYKYTVDNGTDKSRVC